MTMVGDAYAAPLVEELSAAVPTTCRRCSRSAPGERRPTRNTNARCWRLLPQITLINGYGSSETGNVGFGRSQRGSTRRHVRAARGRRWCCPRTTAGSCSPASTEVGWVARAGRIPLGYFDDADATRKTFPGRRGTARGRSPGTAASLAVRRHAASVRPRLTGGQHRRGEGVRRGGRGGAARAPRRRRRAGGRPAERAVGSGDRRAGGTAAGWRRRRPPSHCTPHCTSHLARFKAPKEFIFVEQVRRLGNGKADYRWAKSQLRRNRSRLT